MIFFKPRYLLFHISCVILFLSCSKEKQLKSSESVVLDSIGFYMEKMKDKNLPDSICLTYANKALNYDGLHPNDSVTKIILSHKATLFYMLKKNDSSIQVSKKLLKIARKRSDSLGVASAFLKIGYFQNANYQKDSAYYYFKLSNEIYEGLNDSIRLGKALVRIAIVQCDIGDYSGSDISAVKSLEYLQENDTRNLSTIYNCIAISSKSQEDYKEAIYWYDKAMGISTSNINNLKYLINKANAYRYLQEYDTSIELLNAVLKDSLIESTPKIKARIIDNLAFTKWTADNNSNVKSDLLEAMNIREQVNDYWGLNASYAHLSDFFKEQNSKESLLYANKMYTTALRLKSIPDQLEALQKLIEVDNLKNSKKYYETYVHLNDSLKKAEKDVQNKYAKIKYDSKLNREENLQLKIAATNNELALEKEKTNNIILFTSGSFIFLGLLFFIYYKRQKHLIEKREEVYKTETRIAKKIHDEVANNMVNIMNKVQYTDEPKDMLLDDLEKVYLLTRNISHENNTIETGEKFESFLKAMLVSFNSETTTVILKNFQNVHLGALQKEKQIELYRILQELMVNMRKHSEASLVALTFKFDTHNLYINYSDNGVGCDHSDLLAKNGLENVETRINSIQGTINFETSISNGFKAFISFKK